MRPIHYLTVSNPFARLVTVFFAFNRAICPCIAGTSCGYNNAVKFVGTIASIIRKFLCKTVYPAMAETPTTD